MKLIKNKNKSILRSMAIAFMALSVTTVVSYLFAYIKFPETSIVLAYVLCVLLIARFTDGFIYGIIAAVFSMLAFNFFFTEPYFGFEVDDPSHIITFAVMVVTSIMTSMLTSKIKKSSLEARERFQEELRLREESANERYRATLLRAISHDIRTPLQSIIGNIEILLGTAQEQALKNKLQEINDDANWLHSLVENILNLTRLQDGKLVIKKEAEAIEEVIEVAVRRIKKTYPHIKINVKIPEEYLAVPMDIKLIRQVMLNLLENAVKHNSKKNKIEISVYKEAGFAVVCTRDYGEGIDKNDLPHIFEMFYTKGQNEKKSTGLGLAICEAIIKAHGGSIYAENLEKKNGQGARFVFKLPLEAVND